MVELGPMEAKEVSSGYKHVPWSSWDQWSSVADSLFSSSPDSIKSALARIVAWRSRGCLPMAIEVTASFIEIQQKDPFFRKGEADDTLESEQMLSMLYCMAIMRLVNCFVERSHKRTRRSISQLAEDVGMPRMLVDIRHESSHRDLPSLPIVRLGSMKALDWLKSHYWEPQKKAIPNVRDEMKSRMHELILCIKSKQISRLSPAQSKGIRFKQSGILRGCQKLSSQMTVKYQSPKLEVDKKQVSKTVKAIVRLYSAYPTEVVTVLLEFFQLHASESLSNADVECDSNSEDDTSPSNTDAKPHMATLEDFKFIINRLARKKPELVLSVLKAVIETIETEEAKNSKKGEGHLLSSQYEAEIRRIEQLSSLVPWFLVKLKDLKNLGQLHSADENPISSAEKDTAPRVTLKELLRKCLLLSASGNKHISECALFIAELTSDNSLIDRLKKLPFLKSQIPENMPEDPTLMLAEGERSIRQAAKKLESLKARLANKGRGSAMGENPWSVVKSWSPCPIGMLPCPFSSAPILPVLDSIDGGCKIQEAIKGGSNGKRGVDWEDEVMENVSAMKKMRGMVLECDGSDGEVSVCTSSREGCLLIGGVWRKVGEDELHDIQSEIKVLVC
ncbi:hypothetical protein QJS10_CPB17g01667 [Acorus calamus]|uniref:Las1-like family protein n=1 Tax=Acorus calamus TaxID=4465 RepID=A0AAV9CYA2_ACOCL|nr:hypothetical protein QJS10_CPB17g01667 [Acorus calamus]